MTFKTILIPTDGSSLSEKATRAAIEFAQLSGARVIGMSVALPFMSSPLELQEDRKMKVQYEKRALERANSYVMRIAELAKAANVDCETHVVESRQASTGIVHVARHYQCDAIFMGSSWRRGLARWLCGSETQQVLSQSDAPVIVIR